MNKTSQNVQGISQLLRFKINLQLNVAFQKSPDNNQLMESKINIHLKIMLLKEFKITSNFGGPK
jgi:hypothetical protein